MIVLRAVRVEDSGAETELGEIRLTEVGAVFSHLATADGGAVIADVKSRLAVPAVQVASRCVCRYTPDGRRAAVLGCPAHRVVFRRAGA